MPRLLGGLQLPPIDDEFVSKVTPLQWRLARNICNNKRFNEFDMVFKPQSTETYLDARDYEVLKDSLGRKKQIFFDRNTIEEDYQKWARRSRKLNTDLPTDLPVESLMLKSYCSQLGLNKHNESFCENWTEFNHLNRAAVDRMVLQDAEYSFSKRIKSLVHSLRSGRPRIILQSGSTSRDTSSLYWDKNDDINLFITACLRHEAHDIEHDCRGPYKDKDIFLRYKKNWVLRYLNAHIKDTYLQQKVKTKDALGSDEIHKLREPRSQSNRGFHLGKHERKEETDSFEDEFVKNSDLVTLRPSSWSPDLSRSRKSDEDNNTLSTKIRKPPIPFQQ